MNTSFQLALTKTRVNACIFHSHHPTRKPKVNTKPEQLPICIETYSNYPLLSHAHPSVPRPIARAIIVPTATTGNCSSRAASSQYHPRISQRIISFSPHGFAHPTLIARTCLCVTAAKMIGCVRERDPGLIYHAPEAIYPP